MNKFNQAVVIILLALMVMGAGWVGTYTQLSAIRFDQVADLGTCTSTNKSEIKALSTTGTSFQCDGLVWRPTIPYYNLSISTGVTPSGSGPASGLVLAMVTPMNYGHVLALSLVSRGGGTCTGACPPGGIAVFRVYQGVKTLCTLNILCTLAAGQRIDLTTCPNTAQANQYSPYTIGGGPILAEYATTGQCTANPSALLEAQYDVALTPSP